MQDGGDEEGRGCSEVGTRERLPGAVPARPKGVACDRGSAQSSSEEHGREKSLRLKPPSCWSRWQGLVVKTGLVIIDLIGVKARENSAASNFKAKETVQPQWYKELGIYSVVWVSPLSHLLAL